jgi:hypothetical protein
MKNQFSKKTKRMRIKIDIKNKKNFFYWKIKLKRKITLIKRKKIKIKMRTKLYYNCLLFFYIWLNTNWSWLIIIKKIIVKLQNYTLTLGLNFLFPIVFWSFHCTTRYRKTYFFLVNLLINNGFCQKILMFLKPVLDFLDGGVKPLL